jgi:putative signal transducing protein
MSDLKDRLDAMSSDELLEILERRDTDEWREEVFPIVEALLQARGIQPPIAAAPPVADDAREMGALTSVGTFSTALDANLCKMALTEAGIEAWLPTEYLAGVSPNLGLAIGLDVLVRDEDATRARDVLRELAQGGAALALDPEPCPGCGSTETEYVPQPDRANAIGGYFLAGLPRPAVQWRWVCQGCRQEWE